MEDDAEYEVGPYTLGAQNAQVEGNYILAEKLMLMAVETEEHDALFAMGCFYANAVQQFKKAEPYYLMASERGNANAMFNLAVIYEDIPELQDYDKAEVYYLKACAHGQPNAMFNLALLYAHIKNDYDRAKTWYLKSIDCGDVNAMCNLALLYMEVDEDYDKAEVYYKMAVARGDAGAMYSLGFMFETIKQDYAKAEAWYLKASEYGNEDALNYLPVFYSSTGQDPAKGIEFCQKAHAIEPAVPQVLWMLTYLLILKNDWPEALKAAEQFLSMESAYYSSDLVTELLDKLLKARQYPFLLKLFKDETNPLSEFAQHYYYVLAWFFKDELPGEYENANGEIKEFADEIIARLQDEEAGL
jgi:TPR repeat protein